MRLPPHMDWLLVIASCLLFVSSFLITAIDSSSHHKNGNALATSSSSQDTKTVITIKVINQSNQTIDLHWLPKPQLPTVSTKEDADADPVWMASLGKEGEDNEYELNNEMVGNQHQQAGSSYLIQQQQQQQQQQSDEQQQNDLPALQWIVPESQEEEEEDQTVMVVTVTTDWTLQFETASSPKEQQEQQAPLLRQSNEQPQHSSSSTQQYAKQFLEECQKQQSTTLQDCMKQKLATYIETTRREISFHTHLRKQHALQWEEFACDDSNLPTSLPLATKQWYNERDDVSYRVQVLHQHANSQIHLVENFIEPEECLAATSSADNNHEGFKRAQVHNGKGGSMHKLGHRKALQAGIHVNWQLESEGDLLARLSRRVYDYTNHAMGPGLLNVTHEGQEYMTMIQYNGRDTSVSSNSEEESGDEDDDDQQPDQYKPHCDGPCHGKPHKLGSRMATMVMYCQVPEIGGHTNFRNAGVHIKPTKGSAIFFSYMNPTTKMTDNGFTSHSGCPVYKGRKQILTQWIRYGVDEENPYTSFNTLGTRIDEEEDSDDYYDEDFDVDDEEEEWEQYDVGGWDEEEDEDEEEWYNSDEEEEEEEWYSSEDEDAEEEEDEWEGFSSMFRELLGMGKEGRRQLASMDE